MGRIIKHSVNDINIKQIQSQAIGIVRFPLAVMVVCIHTYFCESLNLRGTEISMEGWMAPVVISLFSISLTHVAVPMFFVLSGYLYFLNISNLNIVLYLSKTKKRLISILVPYLSWNVIALMLSPSRISGLSLFDILQGFWGQGVGLFPWNGPLWFLRDLMIVQFLSPLIYITIKKTKYWLVGMLLLLLIVGVLPTATSLGFTMVSIVYFSVGAYVGIYHKEFYIDLYSKRKLIYRLYLMFILIDWYVIAAKNVEYQTSLQPYANYIHSCTIIFGIPSLFLFASKLAKSQKFSSQLKTLASAGMLIFCMHRLINSKISALGLFVLGKESITSLEALIIYFLTIGLTLSICIYIHFFIAKSRFLVKILEGK